MATVVGTPVRCQIAAPLADVGGSATTWNTATVNLPNVIAINVAFRRVTMSLGSLPPEVRAFKSMDGGVSFMSFTNPFLSRQITPGTASAGTTDKTVLTLPGGYYVLAVCQGTSQYGTSTVALDTSEVHTANVFN